MTTISDTFQLKGHVIMKEIDKKSLDYAEIIIYDNGIFHVHFLDRVPYNIDQAKEITELRKSLMKGVKALVLSTSEDRFVVPNKEAVEYFQSADRMDSVKANAFVIKSFSQRLAFKAVNGLRKMTTPVAYFENEKEAIKWLLSIKD